jgi:hypothetical protein
MTRPAHSPVLFRLVSFISPNATHKCSHDASQNDNDKADSFSSRVGVASFILSDRYYRHLRQALQNTSREKCQLG